MSNDQVSRNVDPEPNKKPLDSERTDHDRAVLIFWANICGLFSTVVICEFVIRDYFSRMAWIESLFWAHLLIIIYFAALAWPWSILRFLGDFKNGLPYIGKHIESMVNKFRPTRGTQSETNTPVVFSRAWPDKKNPLDFRVKLRVGIVLNFIYIGTLIVFTGGIVASPFTSYGVAMVLLGQFIAEFRQSDMRLFAWGVFLYIVIAAFSFLWGKDFIGDSERIALDATKSDVPIWLDFLDTELRVVLSFFLVVGITLLISTFTGIVKPDPK